jgi:serine/threonine protein kinase
LLEVPPGDPCVRVSTCITGLDRDLVTGRFEPRIPELDRYYRAPELILDRNLYGTPIDLWSYGCILAEICRGTPIFVGADSVTQVRTGARVR